MPMSEGVRWTPGPWRVAEDRKYGLHLIWSDDISPGALIARTCLAPRSEANARLIGASPDLYEALKNLVASVESWNASGMALIDAGRAALAKATGETT